MRVTWDPGTRPRDLRDPDDFDAGNLRVLLGEHDSADHGVFAIEALVYCYEARIRPPQLLTDWFGERLAAWLDGQSASIAQALQLQSPGRGRAHPLKQVQLERARSDDAWRMFVLIDVFRKSVPKAAEMVHQLNVERDRNTPQPERLAESWREEWAHAVSPETHTCVAEIFETEEARRRFLAAFSYRP